MARGLGPLERLSIQSGMRVRTEDGETLGRVALIGESVLFVRRWRYSRPWRAVPLVRVERVTGGTVWVAGRASEVLEPAEPWLHSEVCTQTFPLATPPWPLHASA